VCPAPLTPALTARIRELAVATYRAIDAAGMARVDFFLDGQTVLVNEINTIPGFTSTSGYAKMWEATGLAYPDLVQTLIDLALERQKDR
jgi:D-alanine-D-alanine ligase